MAAINHIGTSASARQLGQRQLEQKQFMGAPMYSMGWKDDEVSLHVYLSMAFMCVVSLATNEAYMQHDPHSQSSCPTIFLFMLCCVSILSCSYVLLY